MKDIEDDKDYQHIHQAYQASSNELPPPSIDESILQAAHHAVEADNVAYGKNQGTQKVKSQFGVDTQPVKRAWYVPVSYVAMLVISLSVVMKLALETETSPMLTESELYQPEAVFMDQLEHKELSSAEQKKSTSARSKVATIAESPLLANSPAANSVAPAIKPMKKASPSTAASEMASSEQALRFRQEAQSESLAKSKQRKSQAAMISSDLMSSDLKSRDRREKESSFLAEEADLSSAALSEDKLERNMPGKQMVKSNVAAGLSQRAKFEQDEDLNITADQQLLIDELVGLFENKQFKELEKKLKEYRKTYPRIKNKDVLSRAILDWELENVAKTSQKE